jgi:hypothetical protein
MPEAVGHSARTSPYYFPELKWEYVCTWALAPRTVSPKSACCSHYGLSSCKILNVRRTLFHKALFREAKIQRRALVSELAKIKATRRDHDNALRGKLALARTQVWRAGPSESNTLLSCCRVQPANNPSMPPRRELEPPNYFHFISF